ncbi:hypothetical protein, partial [Mesorhizobium sp. dw_380]|uniref:hypothetical protein n=1 Tax=Mesorhizobium sp. dw_380 TaxID=2812001 RepID=UPI001BDE8DA4
MKRYQAEDDVELLESLEEATLVPNPQKQAPNARKLASVRDFGRRHLPEAGGCLRWDRPAAELSALVPAREFEPHRANPPGVAKIRLPGRVVRVGRLEVLPTRSGMAAGTLLEIGPDYWRVATSSADVVVAKLSGLTGEPVVAGDLARELRLSATEVLPVLSEQDARVLEEVYAAAAEHEEVWVHQLERYRLLSLPFAGPASGKVRWRVSPWREIEALAGLDPTPRVEHLLAVWVLYLARTTGETKIQLGWGAEVPRSPLLAGLLAPVVPLEVEIDLDRTFAEVRPDIVEVCARAMAAGSYRQDLLTQVPQLRRIEELRRPFPWDVAVGVIEGGSGDWSKDVDRGALGGTVTLQIRAGDGAARWIHDPARVASEQVERMTGHLATLAWEALNPASREVSVRRLNLLPR